VNSAFDAETAPKEEEKKEDDKIDEEDEDAPDNKWRYIATTTAKLNKQ